MKLTMKQREEILKTNFSPSLNGRTPKVSIQNVNSTSTGVKNYNLSKYRLREV